MEDPQLEQLAMGGVGRAYYDPTFIVVGCVLSGTAVLGFLAALLLLRRWRWIGQSLSIACLALGIGTLVASARVCMIWDGVFLTAEIRLTFVDENGNPLEGVELRVEDRKGRAFYHYPVTDYLPGQVPTSDKNGLMVFHHADDGVIVSSESCTMRFVPFAPTVAKRHFPFYYCRFLFKGLEVHKTPFSLLDQYQGTWETVPKVKRDWKWSAWPAVQCDYLPAKDKGSNARMENPFQLDDGIASPESAAAARAAQRAAEYYMESLGRVERVPMEFPVLEKTITVELHKN